MPEHSLSAAIVTRRLSLFPPSAALSTAPQMQKASRLLSRLLPRRAILCKRLVTKSTKLLCCGGGVSAKSRRACKICGAGLTATHKQHLVHRDIKPSNIMVSLEEGRLESVKIIDLRLAKGAVEQDTISTAGSFTGTPGYASPEQFAGIGTDIRSDLYSLGVTLWEMLSGKLLFEGSVAELMYQHQHAALPSEILKSVPAPIPQKRKGGSRQNLPTILRHTIFTYRLHA